MNKTIFYRGSSLMLILALIFGQVGAGFFHNKHDAHETVIDLDHTVVLPHGEHCKICAVDLVHQFLASSPDVEVAQVESTALVVVDVVSSRSFSRLLTKDRAPPLFA